MRQYGLDVEYASLVSIENKTEVSIGFTLDIPAVPEITALDVIGQGYGHDQALSAYVGQALDSMMDQVTDSDSIDIEDDTLYCCACSACSGEQEAGPVFIDGFVTLASLFESEISYSQNDTYLGDILQDAYGLSLGDASQYLYDLDTGQFIYVEGFTGQLTKGATLDLNGDGSAILNAGVSSTTSTALATGDQRIDGVINGDYWTGESIDYAFSLSAAPYQYAGTGNEALPGNFNQAISAMQEMSAHFALSSTEGVASAIGFSVEGFTNLTVNFLGNVDSTTAEIRFAETSDPNTGTARVADFPGGQVTSSANDDGDVWFGTASDFRIAEAGNYQWMTMIHEIGHALGLKHGHSDYNFGVLPSDTDSTEFSIMTYRSYIGQNPNGGVTNEQWGFPQTFMMYDIATLQYLYGADFNVNSGDTVYSWTPNSGDTFVDGVVAIEPGGNRIYATIWDGDGEDTYDLSAYDTDLVVDLSPGGYSVFSAAQQAAIGAGNFARGNIFNALQYQGDARSLIENAIGGTGDDSFVGNIANNTIDGGEGVDSVSYANSVGDVLIDLDVGVGGGTGDGSDILISIENATGGSGNDTIIGHLDSNVLLGGEGNDVISGLAGDDVIWGEVGNDTLNGGDGNDVLRGGNNLSVEGLTFGSGAITRTANSGENSIATALNIDNEFSLNADPDIADSDTAPHVTVSATGDGDVHYYAITVLEDGASLTLDIDYGDTSGAGSFNSQLDVYDSAGNIITTNSFAPFMIGGGGSTSSQDAYLSITVATAGTYYIAVSSLGGAAVPSGATYELQVSLSDLSHTDPDSGDDSLNGGNGDDLLFGGLGTDTAVYVGNQANYTVTDNMDGTYTVTDNVGTEGTDTLNSIEFLEFADGTIDIVIAASGMGNPPINGTPGDDGLLLGTSGDDVLNGLAGDDTLAGLEGNDALNGGEGADFLEGGAGVDVLNGGADFDLATYSTSNAAVTVNLGTGAASGGHATGDTFVNIEGLSGSAFDDTLTGDANGNVLSGEGGNDTLDGGASDDFAAYLGVMQSDLIVTDNMDGTYTVEDTTGTHGTDTLTNIEFLLFDNGVSVDITTLATGGPITGTLGDDVLDGTENDDTIDGLAGNDTINGFGGDDVLIGGDGNDNIDGGSGNDTIVGGVGVNTLFGGTGDDIFNLEIGGSGTIDGGQDFDEATLISDTFVSFGWNGGVNVPFLNLDTDGSNFYNLVSVERFTQNSTSGDNFQIALLGSDSVDTLDLSSEAAYQFALVLGGGGDDILIGQSNAQSNLYGGDGNDTITGGTDNDYIEGGYAADTLTGGGGIDVFGFRDAAEILDDVITDANTDDILNFLNDSFVQGYDLSFIGTADFNGIAGEMRYEIGNGETYVQLDTDGNGIADGFMTIIGEFDLAFATPPTDPSFPFDLILQTPTTGPIDGTPGPDNLTGTSGDDIINGLAGNDILNGLAGDDVLNGGDGADRLVGGEGADALNGDAGFDSADYRTATSAVAFNVLTGGTLGDAAGDSFSSIERFYLSDFDDVVTGTDANEFFFGEDGDDVINGGGGVDRIYGGNGDDIQRGGAGIDTLYGGAGADELNGGADFDIANYTLATSAVTVDLVNGGTLGDALGDTYIGIEAVYGSDFNDTLTGNTRNNELRGGDGDDILDGVGGRNRFFGGEGADTFIGGSTIDTVFYTVATAGVIVNVATGGTGGEAVGDTFTSIEWIEGSAFDDDITGDSANNRLLGRDGDDTLDGAGGNDRLLGGDGNDTIFGGDGVDSLFGQDGDDMLFGGDSNDFFYGGAGGDSFDGGAGFDTVNYLTASSGVTVNMLTGGTGGEAAGDTFVSIERVLGTGSDDSITGNADNNTILGNGGDDYLAGGAGIDRLYGGAGEDSYGYDETSDGFDTLYGFTTNETIYLLGGDANFDTWAELQAVGADSGANVVFSFGDGNTLVITGISMAQLSASNFDFGGTPPAGQAPASQTPTNLETDLFAADIVDTFDIDALL